MNFISTFKMILVSINLILFVKKLVQFQCLEDPQKMETGYYDIGIRGNINRIAQGMHSHTYKHILKSLPML